MKQTDAVEIIYSLLPKMKNEEPKDVMHKYAAARGLSAAQLERLGHVFNTASTLATLEKDRNASPPLVNVPSMVDHYVRDTGRTKRASFFVEASTVAAEEKVAKTSEVPNIWGRQFEDLPLLQDKEATDRTAGRRRILEHALECAEQAAEEEIHAVSKFASTLDAVARGLAAAEDPLLKLATLRADIEGLSSTAESDIVCSKLAKSLQSLGVSIANGALHSAPPVILVRDRTGFYPQVQSACEHLKVAFTAHASLLEAATIADQMVDLLPEDWKADHYATRKAATIQNLLEVGGILKEADVNPKASDVETTLRLYEAGRDDKTFDEPYRTSQLFSPILDRGTAATEKLLGGLNQTYSRTIPGYIEALEPEGAVGRYLEPTARSNQAKAEGMRDSRRQTEQDVIAAANLKRLMMTDEVIASKDPERVLEAFNSLRGSSAEATTDISILRLLLRQALETQGVDIDTATAARKFEHGSYRSESSPSRVLR